MIKTIPKVIPAVPAVPEIHTTETVRCCDFCGKVVGSANYRFYSTCGVCGKDICDSHNTARNDLVYPDKNGEYPPVCPQCSSDNPDPKKVLAEAVNAVVAAAVRAAREVDAPDYLRAAVDDYTQVRES